MARPIIPNAVRRSDEGRELEVQSKGGQWIPWTLLSDASRQNTYDAFATLYRVNGNIFPQDSFLWTLGMERYRQTNVPPLPDQHQPQPQPEPEPQPEPRRDDQRPQDSNDQPDQPDPQTESQQPMTIEDMVRSIASELDDQIRPSLVAEINEMLSKFQRETPTDVPPQATLRVEVRTPTQVTTKDGLFHKEFGTLAHLVGIGQHVFLPGPPGSGKSHAAKQVADLIGWQYAELSVSADMPESRMWGGRAHDGWLETPLIAGLRHAMANPDQGFVFLIDEMDAGRPSLFLGTNTAMANRRVTLPCGDEISWGDNVVFIGAANTFGTGPTAEFSGRNKLDAATLDRFAYIPWDTDPIMEAQIVRSFLYDDNDRLATAWLDAWTTLRDNVQRCGLKTFVTMRGARNGARMLASGIDLHKAMMLTIGNKVPADQWAKVCPL